MRLLRVLAACACIHAVPFTCQASDEAKGPAAESLFHEARKLMDAGRFEEACAALQASLALERAVGTLLNLGRCYELTGKSASAWLAFGEAAAEAKRANQMKRVELAESERDRIATSVPRLEIHIIEYEEGAQLWLDGDELNAGALRLPFAINPGEHVLRIERDGFEALSSEFVVAKPSGELWVQKITLGPLIPVASVVPSSQPAPLSDEPEATDASPAEASQRVSTSSTQSESESLHQTRRTLRWVGGALAVLGTVGLGTGIGLGISAKNDAGDAECDEDDHCTMTGLEERDAAREKLDVGYIVGISGGVLVAGGIGLFALSYKPPLTGLTIRAELSGFSSVSVMGRF